MSLEWARARLLQHCEELRKLCEAQAATRNWQLSVQRQKQRHAAVRVLRRQAVPCPEPDATKTGTVLEFAQPGRRPRGANRVRKGA
jgi:hypothetical protein